MHKHPNPHNTHTAQTQAQTALWFAQSDSPTATPTPLLSRLWLLLLLSTQLPVCLGDWYNNYWNNYGTRCLINNCSTHRHVVPIMLTFRVLIVQTYTRSAHLLVHSACPLLRLSTRLTGGFHSIPSRATTQRQQQPHMKDLFSDLSTSLNCSQGVTAATKHCMGLVGWKPGNRGNNSAEQTLYRRIKSIKCVILVVCVLKFIRLFYQGEQARKYAIIYIFSRGSRFPCHFP